MAKMYKDMVIKNMFFKVGQTLTIVGVPKPDASRFIVNIGPNEQEVAMHINPRFNEGKGAVVYNSFQKGSWGEEWREGGFPFHQGEEFNIVIGFNPTEFRVTISDRSMIHFPNRIGAQKYSYLSFEGEVVITSVEIK